MKGRGNWVLRYVSSVIDQRRNAGLDSYPEISIADATKQGQKMQEQLANGIDPLELKRAEENKPSIPTFEVAAREVHSKLLPGWKNQFHSAVQLRIRPVNDSQRRCHGWAALNHRAD